MVRVGTAARTGSSGKLVAMSHQLWTGDVHWAKWVVGLGLGATALGPIELCSNGVC